MTRARIPSGPTMQKAYGILDQFKISRTFFVRTDQEGCALAASDINAANGITAESTVAEATGNEQKRLPILGNELPEPEVPVRRTSSRIPSLIQQSESEGIIEKNDENKVAEQDKKDCPTTETSQAEETTPQR